ncbi:DUF1801 domain-containing protein [Pelagibacterium montanilacus]|uniref:DUF1801 domain-containing protein n=1 Tax=Pelagibacterium montanilacus TaxID=2185280 RepID=UPI000F8C93EF|nr:DUF1801 domain-containing protein [Pelagibacterium montanilacus]
MSANKTVPTGASVQAFLEAVADPRRRADAMALDAIFRETTGFSPRMWGDSIVGYGRYHYRYTTGRQADFLATGFSPRKTSLVVYILPGYTGFEPILARLGKDKRGKSCLYITALSAIDTDVLAELIAAGLADLATHWQVLAD